VHVTLAHGGDWIIRLRDIGSMQPAARVEAFLTRPDDREPSLRGSTEHTVKGNHVIQSDQKGVSWVPAHCAASADIRASAHL